MLHHGSPSRPLLVLAIVGVVACAPPERHNRDDGGNGGSAGGNGGSGSGGSGGAGGGSGGGPAGPCVAGELVCDGPDVKKCDGGKPAGPAVESCGGGAACSAGRCVSPACAAAEAKRTFAGCTFYTLDVDNSSRDDKLENMLLCANPDGTLGGKVEVQARSAGGPWVTIMSALVGPGGVEAFVFKKDTHLQGPGLGIAKGFRVVSDAPIVAYHVMSDDQRVVPPGVPPSDFLDYLSETTGGSILLPAHVLGRSYMPITYTQKTTMMITAFYDELSAASQVTVVGTRDGTHLKFEVASTASTRAGGVVPAKGPGESFEITMDDGDVLQIYSAKDGDDLTGSLVTADKPFALFSGNIATSYGKASAGEGIESADMAHEQMLPLQAWGRSYVAARILPTNDSVTGIECGITKGGEMNSVSRWRIVASEDGTRVTFDAPAGLTGVPTAPVMLDRGRFLEIGVRGPKGNDGDFFIQADRPILVGQFPTCEPSLALATPAEQLLQDFLFVTPPIFAHQLSIVRKSGTAVTLDGKALGDAMFKPAGGGFEVARVDVPPCIDKISSCGHRLRGTDIGVGVRGQDTICGYSFAGAMGVRCVNKTAGCL